MKNNTELTAIPVENLINYAEQIANYIQSEISGRNASPALVEWVKSNIEKVSHLGWNTYNGFKIDRKKEDQLDLILDEVQSLKLR